MKKIRCPYFELNDLERAYHDKEWGDAVPERPQALRVPDVRGAAVRTELGHDHPEARGFKFLGSVTVYAFMQSVGLVNDHARFCFRYKELRTMSRRG